MRLEQRADDAEGQQHAATAEVADEVDRRRRLLARATEVVEHAGERDVVDVVTGGRRVRAAPGPNRSSARRRASGCGRGTRRDRSRGARRRRAGSPRSARRPDSTSSSRVSTPSGDLRSMPIDRRPRLRTSAGGTSGSPPITAAGPVDADHVGAHVGEHHGGERAGADARDLDDLHAGEWSHGARRLRGRCGVRWTRFGVVARSDAGWATFSTMPAIRRSQYVRRQIVRPCPRQTRNSAPGISSAVRRPPEMSTSGSASPWITTVGRSSGGQPVGARARCDDGDQLTCHSRPGRSARSTPAARPAAIGPLARRRRGGVPISRASSTALATRPSWLSFSAGAMAEQRGRAPRASGWPTSRSPVVDISEVSDSTRVGMLDRDRLGDHAAHRRTDDVGAVDAEDVEQPPSRRRPCPTACTALVDRHARRRSPSVRRTDRPRTSSRCVDNPTSRLS